MDTLKNGLPGAKSKRYGFKDVSLGKVEVSTCNQVLDVNLKEGMKRFKIADLNEVAHT